MKRILLGGILLAGCLTAVAQHLTSPNGKLAADITLEDGQVNFSVSLDNRPLLTNARAALVIDIEASSTAKKPFKAEAPKLRLSKKSHGSEHVNAFAYRQQAFDTQWNAQLFRLTSALSIEFRAYDDGIAYRFIQTAKQPLVIKDEVAIFAPEGNPVTYLAYSTNAKKPEAMAFQNIYTVGALSTLQDQWAFMPVTFDLAEAGAKMTILEADLEAYPGMFLRPEDGKLRSAIAPYPKRMEYGKYRGMSHVAETEDFIAKTTGARTFPWRILAVTTDDRQMPVNNLVYALASPNRIGDTSWIVQGKSAWDWWHNWNLKGVPFRAGINMDTYKYYIDFAASVGLQYAILDEGWYDSNKGELMQSIKAIDVPALVEYGRQKGVGIILWTVFNLLDEHLEEACAKYAAMGVKGFKVDFLDRDDQTAVEMAYRIAEACARHHLVLDYHGFYKPTGMNRTYPNLLNIESVFGMEEVKWNTDKKDMPLYDVTFPFIRGMAGHVDYTPGAMRNGNQRTYAVVYDQPISMGTRCHQLAAYVVHDSPLTMLADAATSYQAEMEYTRFLASIPNVVDETRVIDGRLGEYIVVARRAGTTWWLGGMTNWAARDLTLNLQSLDLKGTPHVTLYADGPNANRNAEDYAVSHSDLSDLSDQTIQISMASGGGFVMKIEVE